MGGRKIFLPFSNLYPEVRLRVSEQRRENRTKISHSPLIAALNRHSPLSTKTPQNLWNTSHVRLIAHAVVLDFPTLTPPLRTGPVCETVRSYATPHDGAGTPGRIAPCRWQKSGLVAAVGEAQKLPGGLFSDLAPLGNRSKNVPLPLGGGRFCDDDLLAGQLFKELGAQHGGGRLRTQVKPAEAAEAAGGMSGLPLLGPRHMARLHIPCRVMFARLLKFAVRLGRDGPTLRAEDKVLRPVPEFLLLVLRGPPAARRRYPPEVNKTRRRPPRPCGRSATGHCSAQRPRPICACLWLPRPAFSGTPHCR